MLDISLAPLIMHKDKGNVTQAQYTCILLYYIAIVWNWTWCWTSLIIYSFHGCLVLTFSHILQYLKKNKVIWKIISLADFIIPDISCKHLNLGYFEAYITSICEENNVDKLVSTKCACVTVY